MKKKEIKSLNKSDLNSKLAELKMELIKHNAQIATGTTPKSPGQVKQLKKSVARIKTELKSKEQTEGGDKKA